MKTAAIVLTLLCVLAGCGGGGDSPEDDETPAVTIDRPCADLRECAR